MGGVSVKKMSTFLKLKLDCRTEWTSCSRLFQLPPSPLNFSRLILKKVFIVHIIWKKALTWHSWFEIYYAHIQITYINTEWIYSWRLQHHTNNVTRDDGNGPTLRYCRTIYFCRFDKTVTTKSINPWKLHRYYSQALLQNTVKTVAVAAAIRCGTVF